VQLDSSNFEINENIVENMLDSFSQKEEDTQKSIPNPNPLFANPGSAPKTQNNKKTKIRV